jgi:hypothetical protein
MIRAAMATARPVPAPSEKVRELAAPVNSGMGADEVLEGAVSCVGSSLMGAAGLHVGWGLHRASADRHVSRGSLGGSWKRWGAALASSLCCGGRFGGNL